MFRFMIVFLTMIGNFFDIGNTHVCVNEVISEERKILDEVKDFRLFLEDGSDVYGIGTYYLEKDDFKVELIGSEPILEEYNEVLYVCNYYNGKIKIIFIDMNTLDTSECFLDDIIENINCIDKDLFMISNDNSIYLLGTHIFDNASNIFIYDLLNKSVESIGGKYNEKLVNVVTNNNNLYLSIKKDLISEEPFGNGSEFVLSMLDSNFNVLRNVYLNEHDLHKICVNDSFLYYIQENSLKMFSLGLDYLCSTDLESIKSVFIGQNSLIIVFCEEGGYLLDAFTFERIDEISNDYDGCDIRMLDDKMYAYYEKERDLTNNHSNLDNQANANNQISTDKKNVYFDIVDLRYLNIHNECYLEYENLDRVYSVFGKCEPTSREFQTYFNKTIFGHYDGEQEFVTKYGIAFTIRFTYDIEPKVNLIEGMVYPSGYNLYFNGNGTLDGEFTYNNAPVFGEGNHNFILEGNNENYEVNFTISDNQIPFTDMYVEDGIPIKDGEEFQIKYKLKNYENYVLKDIVLDEWFKDYKYENGELTITFEPLDYVYYEKEKDITIYFKEIVFLVYGKEYIHNVGKVYHFNVVYDDVEHQENIFNEEFIININDKNALSRAMEIELIDYSNLNQENIIKYISLETNNITLDLDRNTKYRANIYLITSNNLNKYKRILLLECDFICQNDNKDFGHLSVSNYEGKIKQLKLKVNSENRLYEARSSSSTLYEKDSDSTVTYITYGICVFGSIIGGIIIRNLITKIINKRKYI